MKFPGKVYICLNCNKSIGGLNDIYNSCNDCKIHYSYYDIVIPLSKKELDSIKIEDDGDVIYGYTEFLFNIDSCKDFQEFMNKVNKMLTFK